MESTERRHSDYIVYVDESGDLSLTKVDPRYPVFVLSFCIFHKEEYMEVVTPTLRRLKFSIFGHDMVILHEHEIRKREGAFRMMNKEPREAFLDRLTDLVDAMNFSIVAVVVDKIRLGIQPSLSFSVYHLAMELGLQRVFQFLKSKNQAELLTHVVCEARGKPEDAALENAFEFVCSGNNALGIPLPFQVIIADKKTNSEGLQIADITARPIGLSVLRPTQSNRALSVIHRKFYQGPEGQVEGYGFYLFPIQSERPQGFPWSLAPAG